MTFLARRTARSSSDEGTRDDGDGERAAADVDGELRTGGGQGWRQVGHRDADIQRRGEAAAGGGADCGAFVQHGVAIADDAAIGGLEAGELAIGAVLLDARERVAAREFGAVVHAHDPAEAGLVRIRGLVDVVAPERERGLEAEGIARAEAARLDAFARGAGARARGRPRARSRSRIHPRRCSRCAMRRACAA